MAWVHLLPGYASLLCQGGRESASSILDWVGVLVNRHRHRQVQWVELDNPPNTQKATFYLKSETAVRWRDRVRNAWHGFGWCATVVREARLLRALREADVGCPEVAAYGSEGRRAFVLLRDQSDRTDLRVLLASLPSDADRHRLAEALGRELAHLHGAGFVHSDLFAKHILVKRDGTSFRFCLLDWARGRRLNVVPWRWRCRDLAVLDATLHDSLAGDRCRLRMLRAYRGISTNPPPLARLARHIRAEADLLRRRRHIREIGQRAIPATDQQFVQLAAGQLLVVRSYFEACGGRVPAEWTAGFEGDTQSWDLPPLAHTLFRLHRFGVPAPRLLAVSRDFLIKSTLTAVPLADVLAGASVRQRQRWMSAANKLIRQVQDAGYDLAETDCWVRCLGILRAGGEMTLLDVDSLEEGGRRRDAERASTLLQPRERQAA